MEAGRENGLGAALLDRLELTPERIAAIARQVRDVAALTDPVGEVVEGAAAAQRPRRQEGPGARSGSSPSSTRRGRT
jgi:gamma-glutamyl phosphate reductase